MEIQILSVEAIVCKIPGFEEFVEKTDRWAEVRASGISRIRAEHRGGPFRVQHTEKNRSYTVPYADFTRAKTITSGSARPLQLCVHLDESADEDVCAHADRIERDKNRALFSDVIDIQQCVQAKDEKEQLIVKFINNNMITINESAWVESVYHPEESRGETNV